MDPVNFNQKSPIQPDQNPSSDSNADAITSIKTTKSNGITVLAVAIFILSALSIVAFLYYQNQQLKKMLAQYQVPTSPTPTVTSDPTANWKTHSINDLTFKYPSTWTLDTTRMLLIKPTDQKEEYPSISFYTIKNPKDLTVEEYQIETAKEGPSPNLYSESVQIIKVSGMDGYYLKNTGCEPLACDRFSISYNQNIYVAQIIYPDKWDLNLRTIFEQVLSTFEFTDVVAKISQTQAVEKVSALQEVKDYLSQVPNGKVAISISKSTDSTWSVQVYESFPDHNATFAWYEVNKTTGKVTKKI